MRKPNPLLQHEPQIQVTQAKLNGKLLHKADPNKPPVLFQRKSLQRIGLTTTRTLHYEVQEDNTLRCTVCGRRLPLTHQGNIDKVQLESEIALRQFLCLSH